MSSKMIENERQLSVTRKQLGRFRRALAAAISKECPDDTDPVIWQSYILGIKSQIETMETEITSYVGKSLD